MERSYKGSLHEFLTRLDDIDGMDLHTAFANYWFRRPAPVALYDGERLVTDGRRSTHHAHGLEYRFLRELLDDSPKSISEFLTEHRLMGNPEQLGECLEHLAKAGIVRSCPDDPERFTLGQLGQYTVKYREMSEMQSAAHYG